LAEVPDHVRRFCKDILRQYPLMKRELAAMEEERKAIAEAVPAAAWQEPARVKAVGDRTAKQAFRLLRLEERWQQVGFYVKAVEDLLNYLDDERRELVKLRFFDNYPPWKTAQALNMSVSNVYRWQNEVLVLLAHRLGL